jgi:glycosyltransferase involved in cell wall biosynthesis
MLKDGISIIICCYNSSLRIEKTLEYLAAQIISGIECEIILVDNASTDNTSEIAKSLWAKIQPNNITLNVVSEQQPGLSNARLKGISVSAFEFLVFCDDDNWLDEKYVQNVNRLFNERSQVSILGGSGTAEFEDGSLKPLWFDTFYHSYAVDLKAGSEAIVNNVYGAGMAIRKSVLKNVTDGQVMFLHGRKGPQLTSGEDSEICLRTRLVGSQILYSPQLRFKHYITSDRLTWGYLKRLHIGFAKSNVVLNLYNKALNSKTSKLPFFYWLKKALYYWGIYLKYWPKHYFAYRKGEGTNEEILHITWKSIALNYLEYNFKAIRIYSKIFELKQTNKS